MQTSELLSNTPEHGILHQLRPVVMPFIGHDDIIEQVVQTCRATPTSSATVILTGREGIGTTELAFVLAHRLRTHYPDAQLVLDGRGTQATPQTPQRLLQQIIHTFKPQSHVINDIALLQERYRKVLAGKRVIIIADTIRDEKHIRYLAPPDGCFLIVTSRQPLTLRGTTHYELPPLSPSEAEQLLHTLCPRLEAHTSQLADLCGGIPLALRMSAGVFAHDTERDIVPSLDTLSEALANGIDPVEAALRLSYDALGPLEQATLRQISIFPASFDMQAARAVVRLHSMKHHTPTETSADGGAESSPPERQRGRTAPPAGEQIMRNLVSRHVIAYDGETESYNVHPLVGHTFASMLADEEQQAIQQRYAKYYAELATEIESLYLKGGDDLLEGLDIFDQERVHIETSWNWARTHQRDTLLLTFLCIVGHTGLLRYHLSTEYIPQAEQALAAARRLKRRAEECHILNVLGSAHRALGDLHTSIEYYKQALRLVQTVRKQTNEVSILGNLGNAYLSLGDVKQAMKHYKRSLSLARKHKDVRGESAALGQVGLAFAEQGRTTAAMDHYEQSLDISRQCRYRDYEAETLTGMGSVSLDMQELEHAVTLCTNALTICQEMGNRRDEGYALMTLGRAYAARSEFAQAREHHTAAHAIASEVGDRRLENRVLGALGEVELAQVNLADSIRSLEDAYAIACDIGDHRGRVMSAWFLGLALTIADTDEEVRARAYALMQERIDYEQAIEHPAAQEHQEMVGATHNT